MRIFVGSQNPVKINAVITAASETWPNVQVVGYNVPSGISEQPRSDDETKKGAINRAYAALEDGLSQLSQVENKTAAAQMSNEQAVLGVGLEGGVTDIGKEMWSTVWSAVVDHDGSEFLSNGARFIVPPIVADRIRNGQELGPLIAQLTEVKDVRKKQGYIGIATNGFIDRTEEYSSIAKLALGLWYGRHWQNNLKTD